jgi:hypothetical protein
VVVLGASETVVETWGVGDGELGPPPPQAVTRTVVTATTTSVRIMGGAYPESRGINHAKIGRDVSRGRPCRP